MIFDSFSEEKALPSLGWFIGDGGRSRQDNRVMGE